MGMGACRKPLLIAVTQSIPFASKSYAQFAGIRLPIPLSESFLSQEVRERHPEKELAISFASQ